MTELLVPGVATAILAMTLATYLCRISGYYAMNLIPLTPRLKRALAALPGSIIAAAVLPSLDRIGPAATLAVVAGLLAMLVKRSELLALVVGLGVAVAARPGGCRAICRHSGRGRLREGTPFPHTSHHPEPVEGWMAGAVPSTHPSTSSG